MSFDLLRPTNLFFIFLIILMVVIVWRVFSFIVKVARGRRVTCTWSMAKANVRLWEGIALIVLSLPLLLFPFVGPRWLVLIFCCALAFTGTYQTAKAVYRKHDIKSAQATDGRSHVGATQSMSLTKSTILTIALGSGFFVFGILGITARGGNAFGHLALDLPSRLLAALGATLAVAGIFLRKSPR